MMRRKIFIASMLSAAAIIFFLASGLGTGISQDKLSVAAHLPAQRITIDGVSNSGQVTPTLFRGAQPTLEGFDTLSKKGIAIVVDLRFEGDRNAERLAVTHAGMQYVGMPWSCHFPRDAITARFLQFVLANPNEKIFVHCQHGVDRTGLMIAAYRMAEQDWTPEQAQQEMIAYGFDYVHRTWCSSVSSYVFSFPQHFSSSPEFDSLRPAAKKEKGPGDSRPFVKN
jgi:tyrosine-protein phosphatase SIW14